MCGILGLVTFWFCGLGALLGLVAVVLSALGLNAAKKRQDGGGRGLAIGGLVTGILAILLGIGFVLAFGFLADQANNEVNNFNSDEFLPEINTDPSDGFCDEDRFFQDPDC